MRTSKLGPGKKSLERGSTFSKVPRHPMKRKREILSIEPTVVQRESGCFAVSPPGACLLGDFAAAGVRFDSEAEWRAA